MDLSETLILIKDFLSPANKLDQIGLNEISLSTIISNIIDNFINKHSDFNDLIQQETDSFWKYGLISLRLIRLLNESNFQPNKQQLYFSINEERLISSLCQLITCFCIHYNLEDNIGVSIEKLSKYGVNLTKKRNEISVQVRNSRLNHTLECLYDIKQNKREHIDLLNLYFYRKYIHDIICALIQVLYSPNSILVDTKKKECYEKWLEVDLFEESDGANLVSNLIMAQSSAKYKQTEWFTIIIGKLLTKCLLRPNSVMNVIRAVLTEMNAISTVTLASDWKKCDVVARILAQCPKDVNTEDYVKLIAPQLLNLFFSVDQRFSKHFYRVSGSVYSIFAQRWPKLTYEYITKNIISSFYPSLNEKEEFKLNSKQFMENLNKLHLVYVTSTEPNWNTLNQLPVSLICLLFKIYTLIRNKINARKSKSLIEDLIKIYVKINPKTLNFLTSLLKESLLNNDKIKLNFETYDDEVEDECCLIEYPIEQTNPITVEMVEKNCQSLIELIKCLNDPQLQIDLMIYIFSELSNFLINPVNEISDVGKQTDKTLLNIEENIFNKSLEINFKIIFFTFESKLFEIIEPEMIVKNHEKVLNFCKLILENYIKLIKTSEFVKDETENDSDLLHLILSIISVFTTGVIEINYEIKKNLQIFLSLLFSLKDLYQNTEIENMSQSLYVSIATFLGVKTEHEDFLNNKKEKILIEELDTDSYSLALKDINDPLIPVKAHGLVQMRKLVENRDEKCIQNKSFLIDLAIRNLKNEDSYVYLAAVNFMISLVDLDPDRVLDVLIEQYLSAKNKLDVENRLKIGEVLTKTVRNFNQLVPKYGHKLINTFLHGCKNSEEMIRSSSLSNLGETCKLLNYSLADNIYELINCLSSLIDTDSSIHVKRTAVMVLKMIIEGLKKENFIQVLGSSIAPLYKLLIRIKSTSKDDVIRLNCQLTSDYINDLMKHSMFPKQTFQKEIKVLRP